MTASFSTDLREVLGRPALFPGGYQVVSYDCTAFEFQSEVARYLVDRGFSAQPLPLEQLHRSVSPGDQQPTERGLNAPTTELHHAGAALVAIYHRLIRHIAEDVLGFDVVFERNPMLRFHFPVPLSDRFRSRRGYHLTHHSDTMFGDLFEQINCWLPLTTCSGSNSLQIVGMSESLLILNRFAATLGYDFAAYRDSRHRFFELLDADDALQDIAIRHSRGVDSRLGELILFDPRMIHGTGENREGITRVSLDFRLVPVEVYEEFIGSLAATASLPHAVEGELTVRGDFFHERTALEL